MSARQAKINRKAAKRKAKLIAYARTLQFLGSGVEVDFRTGDYGLTLVISARHLESGGRSAAIVRWGRKAKTTGTKLQSRIAATLFRVVAKVKLSAWIAKEVDRMAYETLAGVTPPS